MIKQVKKPREIRRIEIDKDGWPKYGLLRCDQIISPGGILPLSKSQFWVLVKQHDIPVVKLSPKVTCFWVQDLRRIFLGVDSALSETDAPSAQEVAITAQDTSTAVSSQRISQRDTITSSNKPLAAISNATANPGGRRPVSKIPTPENI